MAGALLDSGARSADLGRLVAVAHDALQTRILRDAEAKLGVPPCPYAWIVLGSEGRCEQTLRTDQDNALIYADAAPPAAARYFERFANEVIGQLIAVGFPRCPGDYMASNSRWRQPLEVWRNYFQQWIEVPDEQALLSAAIFFDYRQIAGTLDAAAALRPIVARAAGKGLFLAHMGRAALEHAPPLNFFRQLALREHAGRRGLLDLKLGGTGPIVALARLFALEAGVEATNTIERLRRAGGHSNLDANSAEELIAAFELISQLRVQHQFEQLRQGQAPDNLVPVAELSNLERRSLKEALLVVARLQRGVEAMIAR
jgi:CBS domain-containing protein